MPRSYWKTPLRLAWRNVRGSGARTAFIVGAITISIATVTAISHGAAVVRQSLSDDRKVWLKGDVAVETSEPISDAQIRAFDAMKSEGIEWTMVTFLLTMASTSESPNPASVTLKVIDPAVYPFYGIRFRQRLEMNTVAVSQTFLDRLHVRVGDRIRIARHEFTISEVSSSETEFPFGVIGRGPQATISAAAFESIGTTAAGNTRLNRIVLRLPGSIDPLNVMQRLQALVPEGRVLDYREAARPEVERIELVISFASVSAFLVIVLGAIGVGAGIRLNLDQRIATLAILRVEGARTLQIIAVVIAEAAILILASLPTGMLLGWGFSAFFLSIAGKHFHLTTSPVSEASSIAASALAGVMMMVPLLAGPMHAIARLRPMILARADFPEERMPLPLTRGIFLAAVAIAGAAAIFVARILIHERTPALLMSVALLVATGAAWLLSAGALKVVRRWIHSNTCPRHWRQALVGLYRPGSSAAMLIACLALGVMSISATFDSSRTVSQTVVQSLPYPRANLLVAGFDADHREAVRQFLERQPGVGRIQMITEVWLRLAAIDRKPVAPQSFAARCVSDAMQPTVVANDLAARLGVRPGSRLNFELRDATFSTTVGAIRQPTAEERFWMTFIVDCNAIPHSAWLETAAVEVQPDRLEAVHRALAAEMPTLPAITAGEVLATIESVTGDLLALARVTFWSVAFGGLLILASMIAVSRAARSKEIAILAALGASRNTIARLFTIEFAAMGIFAAAVGIILAALFGSLITRILFYRTGVPFDPGAAVLALIVCPLVTIAAGWLPLYPLLKQRPLEILRQE